MEKMRKVSVLKEVRNNGMWAGYIAPSKVSYYHVNSGWHLGIDILVTQGRDGSYYVVREDGQYEFLEAYLNSFEYYNCNSELGYSVRFFVN